MSFRSIIQEMREEIGSVSRKGFQIKLGYGLRSGSHRVLRDRLRSPPIEALKQSCWANLPPELLRDVLTRIEEAQALWPHRKDVVSCAGVCRSWREIMKEIVKSPAVSGKLTFPISVKQPGPRDFPLQCFIKRNQATQTFYLYFGLSEVLSDDGKFLLAARKCRHATCTDYLISIDADDMSKGSGAYVGKLRSNFLGRKFTVYDSQPPPTEAMLSKCHSTRLLGSKQVSPRIPAGNYPVVHIAYDLNVLGSMSQENALCPGFYPCHCNGTWFKSSRMDNFSGLSNTQQEVNLILKNKAPRWHEQLQCWCLNFRGRVTVASVKNFQLVAEDNGIDGQNNNDVILQFGKVGKDLFTMDYQYPISAFQAFSICLSSFDTKLACE
ncbi:tubby-like F-box protein 6 isoform X3 [Phalaenopsis equestris]|uniref:tubby-like F-box protein 6 isoform X3 n=1 Tax=Phalaenopsis equestris TaxID=78828 RepID=UPI0009E39FEA|nr:tubby-like F-box protein 6 isoform X3 [Phalaenopsis equestris]